MSKIFNISFDHKGHSYTALVSVAGSEKDNNSITITTYDDKIRMILPSGTLVFSITDVLQRLFTSRQTGSTNGTLWVTENISLQLMNTNW